MFIDENEIDHTTNMEIELLLEGMYRLSGYDFRNYMRSSIWRRIQNRMRIERVATITGLLDKAIHEPGFIDILLNDFSINVTEMFRDPHFFYSFRKKVVPLLRDLPEIRIWHAGCATGEEVFSMAILMDEEGLGEKTKIYATDMNEQVLEKAKCGIFPLSKMQVYTKNYMQAGGTHAFSEYYTADFKQANFNASLKKNIIFFQHNLVTDQSFNEFHVIICRNVLIYFNAELQNQVHELFYESLCPNGFLGLGDNESLRFATRTSSYGEFDNAERIYRKL
ncbi:CheR family methyltransferase [Heyndrickxia vini]|uniref:Protein-glutamate O-methyltransferase CheR n=1 Tax=Heyndrickxia vini TaxID=1476025 RepID=A0ABX7E4F9_9BACI|nr:protein-glutamate O-methyltransferase CheR [Heyndrickxia vini]QQZ10175.1 protein-glutamate O-methyltransferase CheR [Heyndrickxia vini]